MCKRGRAAYIESADPSQSSVTQGFKERIKVGTLLETSIINDLYSDRLIA